MEKEENSIVKVLEGAVASLKEIMDGNSVIGKPYALADGTFVMPVSKITLAYITGGGEYAGKDGTLEYLSSSMPILAGNGGFVQLTPMGFLALKENNVSCISVEKEESAIERVLKVVADNLTKGGKK